MSDLDLAAPDGSALDDGARGPARSVPEASRRFGRWCVRLAVALAVLGVAGLVHPLWALSLAGLLGVLAGMARLAADDAARADAAFSPADPAAEEPEDEVEVEVEVEVEAQLDGPGDDVAEAGLDEPGDEDDVEAELDGPGDDVVEAELDGPGDEPVLLPTAAPPAEPRVAGPGTVIRTFSLPASVGAERVHVVGEFNGWSSTAHPMRCEGDRFTTEVELEVGRSYRFRYLLDGVRWENDWAADDYVPNWHGSEDSVVRT